MAQAPFGAQLRHLVTLLAATAGTRLDLARLELAEWRGQLGRVLLFSALAIITAFFALLTLVIAVLVQCWDTCREVAAWSLPGFFGITLLIALIGLNLALKRSRRFLPTTIDVLREDLESLKHE
ncbi:MAG TPA: phage holin family protein [Candidatus Macondimonas sp.]|nr:phage holin family protein [Candidatus Macondimonas sp.]